MDRKCAFCRGVAPQTHDNATHRLNECEGCGADFLVTKGKTSWWYHGWEHPDGRRLKPELTGYSKSERPAKLAPHWRRGFFAETVS